MSEELTWKAVEAELRKQGLDPDELMRKALIVQDEWARLSPEERKAQFKAPPPDDLTLTIQDCEWAAEKAREEAHDADFEDDFDGCVEAEDRADRFEAHARDLKSRAGGGA